MQTDIEIHIRKDGTQIVSVNIGGRIISMPALEWLFLCNDVKQEIETHLTKLALDLPETWAEIEHPSACIHRQACIFYKPASQ